MRGRLKVNRFNISLKNYLSYNHRWNIIPCTRFLQVKSSQYSTSDDNTKKDSTAIDTNNNTTPMTNTNYETINTAVNEEENAKKEKEKLDRNFRRTMVNWFYYFCGFIGTMMIYVYIKNRDKYRMELPSNLADKPLPSKAYFFSVVFPNRAISRIAAPIFEKELPVWMRKPLYSLWGMIYDVRWNDFKSDITQYRSLKEFFIRKLEVPRDISNNDIISPVDGTVLTFGEITKDESNDWVMDQIKGVPYKLKQFIGEIPNIKPDNKLYYIIIYLSPGDYHRFHAPNNVIINSINHIVGDLYPVRESWLKMIPGLFSLNERIILKGTWNINDLYYYIPVGAFNVGSIKLFCDNEIQTNLKIHDKDIWYKNTNKILNKNNINGVNDEDLRNALWNTNNNEYSPYFNEQTKQNPYNKQYYQTRNIAIDKGNEIGYFEFGSTIVMLFEANNFKFICKENTKIQYGQPIGDLI